MIKIVNFVLGTFCHSKKTGRKKPVLAKIVIAKQDTLKGSIQPTGHQFATYCLTLNFSSCFVCLCLIHSTRK